MFIKQTDDTVAGANRVAAADTVRSPNSEKAEVSRKVAIQSVPKSEAPLYGVCSYFVLQKRSSETYEVRIKTDCV